MSLHEAGPVIPGDGWLPTIGPGGGRPRAVRKGRSGDRTSLALHGACLGKRRQPSRPGFSPQDASPPKKAIDPDEH